MKAVRHRFGPGRLKKSPCNKKGKTTAGTWNVAPPLGRARGSVPRLGSGQRGGAIQASNGGEGSRMFSENGRKEKKMGVVRPMYKGDTAGAVKGGWNKHGAALKESLLRKSGESWCERRIAYGPTQM